MITFLTLPCCQNPLVCLWSFSPKPWSNSSRSRTKQTWNACLVEQTCKVCPWTTDLHVVFILLWPWPELCPPLLWAVSEWVGVQPAILFPGWCLQIRRPQLRDQLHPCWHSGCRTDNGVIKLKLCSPPRMARINYSHETQHEIPGKMCLNVISSSSLFFFLLVYCFGNPFAICVKLLQFEKWLRFILIVQPVPACFKVFCIC